MRSLGISRWHSSIGLVEFCVPGYGPDEAVAGVVGRSPPSAYEKSAAHFLSSSRTISADPRKGDFRFS